MNRLGGCEYARGREGGGWWEGRRVWGGREGEWLEGWVSWVGWFRQTGLGGVHQTGVGRQDVGAANRTCGEARSSIRGFLDAGPLNNTGQLDDGTYVSPAGVRRLEVCVVGWFARTSSTILRACRDSALEQPRHGSARWRRRGERRRRRLGDGISVGSAMFFNKLQRERLNLHNFEPATFARNRTGRWGAPWDKRHPPMSVRH
jgi:hypothetical protein